MANWLLALALCASAEAACGAEGSATCVPNDEHALVQKDLTVVNAHKVVPGPDDAPTDTPKDAKKEDINEFEFLGKKYKLDGPFAYCRVAAFPASCALAMAPSVLLPGGTLFGGGTYLNKDGTVMTDEEKAQFKYDLAVNESIAHNETPSTTDAPTTTNPWLVTAKIKVANPKAWLKQNDWCPSHKGTCGLLVGLLDKEYSSAVAGVVHKHDADAEAFYLETLSKVQGEPAMAVVYPKDMRVDCCLMYKVLKTYRGVSYIDFDKDGTINKYGKKDRQHAAKPSKPSKLAKQDPKQSKPADDSDSESAGSRMALGVSTLVLAALAVKF